MFAGHVSFIAPLALMRFPATQILFATLCGLLVFCTTACGEIELPQPETPEQTDKPGTPEPGKSDDPEKADDSDTPDSPDTPDTPDAPDTPDSPDTPDEPDTPAAQIFGTVKITADGHLLVNDSFYLSTTEFFNVVPASATPSGDAASYAASYKEGDLTDWHIPTMDEAKALREALACTSPYYTDEGTEVLPKLNKALTELDLDGLYREWYLCDDANYVFDFITGDEIKKASKSKKYRLRLTRSK